MKSFENRDDEKVFIRRGRDGDEEVKEPCAICKKIGNRNLYKCEICGRWICGWNCMSNNSDICVECKKRRREK